MTKTTAGYGNDSISQLKGADRVRKRPGVIFGSDGLDGCQHAVFEILSNSTLIQLVASTSEQNVSGLPNSPCFAWAAMAFHISQDSPAPFFTLDRSGAWVWSP